MHVFAIVVLCSRIAEKPEMSAGNISFSHNASETTVMPAEQNHLSLSGTFVYLISAPLRYKGFVILEVFLIIVF